MTTNTTESETPKPLFRYCLVAGIGLVGVVVDALHYGAGTDADQLTASELSWTVILMTLIAYVLWTGSRYRFRSPTIMVFMALVLSDAITMPLPFRATTGPLDLVTDAGCAIVAGLLYFGKPAPEPAAAKSDL